MTIDHSGPHASRTGAGTHTDTADVQAAEARSRRDADEAAVPVPAAGTSPALSVIVPTHDVGPWIRETLQSLTSQTFTDLEIIVVEDHSTDETDDIIAELAGRDPRVRVIRPSGRGGAHARNIGVAHARGRWLAFCDGDDIVPENAYAALMSRTSASDAALLPDLVCGDFLKYRPNRTWRPAERAGTFTESHDGCTLLEKPQIIRHRACWNKIFRKDFWDGSQIVFPEVVRSNDIVPMVQAYTAATSIDLITDVTYIYRDRPGASSMSAKVGSTASLASYLQQELICASLVDGIASPAVKLAVKPEYDWMLLNADAWVQVSEYLARLDGAPADPAISAQVAALLGQVDDTGWTSEVVPALRRRWALALCRSGQLDAAARVLRLTTKDRDVPDPVAEIAEWADALDTTSSTADWRGPSAQEIFDRWLPRRIRAALAAPDTGATADVVQRLERHRDSRPHQVAQPHDAPPPARGLLGRLRGRR